MKTSIYLLGAALLLWACNNNSNKPESNSEQPAAPTVLPETPPASAPAPATFSQNLTYEKIAFQVSSNQLAENNTVLVVPSGFSAVNDSVRISVSGTVVKAETGDISGDNAPELLIVTKDEKGNGHAYMFSGNGRKSMSEVNVKDITDKPEIMNGYNGEDEFALVENTMVRRFPLFKEGAKTGKTRQVQYKLALGESMKELRIDKVVEY